jgi:hypothetical protein
MDGSNHSYQRALHCLADFLLRREAIRAHWFLPYFITAALRISSSEFLHTPPLTMMRIFFSKGGRGGEALNGCPERDQQERGFSLCTRERPGQQPPPQGFSLRHTELPRHCSSLTTKQFHPSDPCRLYKVKVPSSHIKRGEKRLFCFLPAGLPSALKGKMSLMQTFARASRGSLSLNGRPRPASTTHSFSRSGMRHYSLAYFF